MNFDLNKTIEVLQNTPKTLAHLLGGISDDWIYANEGENTWSPYDVIGHLIHGEKTDWIPRLNIILFEDDKNFIPFDRFAQFENSKDKSLKSLLTEFEIIRKENIAYLQKLNLKETDWQKEGNHPEFGPVTVQQLLATWATHDLGHIAQICRVMAKHYKEDVGPWSAYISILNK